MTEYNMGNDGFRIDGVPVIPGGGGIMAMNNVYFVNTRTGSDGNKGQGTKRPFATIQKALDTVVDGDTIFVFPGSYDEKLTTGQQAKVAVSAITPGRGRYCQIIGVRPTDLPYDTPQLYNVSSTTATIELRSPGWRLSGFRIVADSGAPICVKTQMAQPGSTADTNWAPGLMLDHCVFYGAVGNASGLSMKANTDCRILSNKFHLFATAGLGAIVDEGGGFSFSARHEIAGNIFEDNVSNIIYGFKACSIHHNVVGNNQINTMTTGFDMEIGGDNAIYMNQLGGTYQSGGVYTAGSAGGDNWIGNMASSGTGVTGGWSTADPGS